MTSSNEKLKPQHTGPSSKPSQYHYWWQQEANPPSEKYRELARSHQLNLTKPPGALGYLEDIALEFSAFQHRLQPQLDRINIVIFAGDHGVCKQGVSAFPQIVTAQMVENFVAGGAAISVLAKLNSAKLSIVNMGLANPVTSNEFISDCSIAQGTADFSRGPAMSLEECLAALEAGKQQVKACDLFIGGEMGIGNTTSASALFCALLSEDPRKIVGPGTGISNDGLKTKIQVIEHALRINKQNLNDHLSILAALGGFEIAALVGAYMACAQKNIPILIDGFISTAAALVATKLMPSCRPWMLFSHQSAEPAHSLCLVNLNARPIVQLDMRLGEGSGAAVAIPLIKSALALQNQMATFSQAGVSENG